MILLAFNLVVLVLGSLAISRASEKSQWMALPATLGGYAVTLLGTYRLITEETAAAIPTVALPLIGIYLTKDDSADGVLGKSAFRSLLALIGLAFLPSEKKEKGEEEE